MVRTSTWRFSSWGMKGFVDDLRNPCFPHDARRIKSEMASLFGEGVPVADLLRQEGSMLPSIRVDARALSPYFCSVPEALLATHRGLLVRLLCGTYICRESFPSDRLRMADFPRPCRLSVLWFEHFTWDSALHTSTIWRCRSVGAVNPCWYWGKLGCCG